MKRCRVVLVLVWLVAAVCTADAVEVATEIDRVVVFRDRAEVTRVGQVELESGEHELVFDNLVGGLIPDSLRVSAEGTVEALIGGLDIEPVFLEESAQQRTRALRDEITELEDELRRIKDETDVLDRQLEFINSIKARKSDQIGTELTEIKPDVDDWQALVEFLGSNFTEIARKRFDGEIRGRDISARINKLRAELGQVESRAGTRLWTVTSSMSVPAGGTIDVALTYVVQGAAWTPIYNARYIEADKSVELDYLARVRQATGEDWDDVAVALSTAEPRIGAQVPELRPWNLAFAQPRRVAAGRARGTWAGKRAAPEMAQVLPAGEERELMANGFVDQVAEPPAAARYVEAPPESRGTLVQFAVPGRQSIPADNREHRVTVMQTTLDGETEYVCVPKLGPYCYLETKLTNDLDAPLLAGPVNVFVGPNFTGQSRIKTIALEEEFDLSFGVDEGIKVTRDEIENERSDAGMFNRGVRWTRKYKFTVANHKAQPQTVVITDQLPVSQDEDIKVREGGTSLEPTERTDQGVLTWKLDLEPREKREFTFGYVVEYPKGKTVPGF